MITAHKFSAMRRWNYSMIVFVFGLLAARGDAAEGGGQGLKEDRPRIEKYATIEAYVGKDETPVYAFGSTYVYAISPDLLPGVVMQEGNSRPVVKVRPKKSWEIKSNLCGSTPAREPKSMWNDDQPLLPIHLIDGDPETAWSSRGSTAPDTQPEWIRIDLPMESTVASVALVCSAKGPSGLEKVGKMLPKAITVKLGRDGRNWETVYETKSLSGRDTGPAVLEFAARPAKQVWIVARDLQPVGDWVGNWGHVISLGEIEVRDPAGNNLALVSRGAGVQVSSTYYGYGMDRNTQRDLWPLQYDLGFKWTRVGYDMGMYLWSYVEREKGKLEIDPEADAAVSNAVRNGMSVILCLDKGNWLYRDPPRKLDWRKSRVREMMETYYDHQGWPHESAQLLEGYLRYVDYMVRHFKGRVAYYEICNEWEEIGIENYVKIVRATIPAIKRADPDARIMLGSTSGFSRDLLLTCLGKKPDIGIRDGRFRITGNTIAVVDGVQAKDVRVAVDALSDGEAGIVLRFQDPDNFLLAICANDSIYFHEVVGGNFGLALERVMTDRLAPDIHLAAEVKGADVKLTVSDGSKTFTTRHTVKHGDAAGAVGLFHNVTPRQEFDRFQATDPDGKELFRDSFTGPERSLSRRWKFHPTVFIAEGLAGQLDAVGWHPFYQVDPDNPGYRSYREDVGDFRRECRELGFRGQFAATEWTWAAPYPPAPGFQCSEMEKAKYSAQLMTAHAGMDVISLYNETFQTGKVDWDCTLVRNGFSVDPVSAVQPQPAYYVLRNLSTVLDGFQAAEFGVTFSGQTPLECYTFKQADGPWLLAAWIPGKTKDGIVEARNDVTVRGIRAARACVVDLFNGTEQELTATADGADTVLPGIRVKDYPTFIRIEP